MVIAASRERHSSVPKDILKDILILQFGRDATDLKSQVYQATLDFIGAKLMNVEVYPFHGNEDLVKYISEKKFSSVIFMNNIPRETAFLLKGIGMVQILIGLRADLENVCDIIIDPLLLKSERFLVGPRYLLPSILTQVSAETLADVLGTDPHVLTEEVGYNRAETELLEIVQLYQKLVWDSKFFGINVGYISCLRLTANIERHIKRFIRKEKINLLEYLCNCHDRESVMTSEKNGYSFVDIRLTFEQYLSQSPQAAGPKGYDVRKGTGEDVEVLKGIATGIYKYSRYYFDENFNRERVVEFYTNWAEKAVYGQFDDYAYVLCHDSKPIGFCTIKKTRKNAATIGLLGLHAHYNGKGLGMHLLNTSLAKLREEEGVNHVEVVTQGRNYEAQRLYQRCGFMTKSTELWYHKWFY